MSISAIPRAWLPAAWSSGAPIATRREFATIIAIVTALTVWWAWGALQPLPVVQDEYSYVLQSRIFASGHWTAPSPPVAELFQQPHVLTTPAVASKYPPGHALILTLGALLGVPWLIPLIVSAIAGVLVFVLASQFLGVFGGFAAWIIWLTDPINLRFQPGYYSELTSGTMLLVSWWALLRWLRTKNSKWLCAVAAAVGVIAITRPLSAVAIVIPIGFVVVKDVVRRGAWRGLMLAVLAGTAVVSILPLWSFETTGQWTRSPVTVYREQYLPFDKPGFGLDRTQPSRALSPVNADVYSEFAREHSRHTVGNLPAIVVERLKAIGTQEWGGWRITLLPFFVLGLVVGNAALWFATACALALFGAYLSYAHWHEWTLYYLESLPVLAFATAAGMSAVVARLQRAQFPRTRWIAPAASVGLVLLGCFEVSKWRRYHIEAARYDTAFHEMIRHLPFDDAVVFVRYGQDMHPHTTVVTNSATLPEDRVWVVIDDPTRDRQLMRAAGRRVPLLFEERDGSIRGYRELLDSTATASSPYQPTAR